MDASALLVGIIWYLAFLFSTTLHEAAHAWAALRLGDPTAYQGGQVTLSPLPHIRREPWGMVLVPLISTILLHWPFGWASAPYDPRWSYQYPKRAGWMALAGPASNFALMFLAGAAMKIGLWVGIFSAPSQLFFEHMVEVPGGGAWEGVATVLSIFFMLNLILGLFNLIPLPPMDGSAVIQLFLSEEQSRRYQEFVLHQSHLGMVGLLIAWYTFGPILDFFFKLTLLVLYPGLSYS